MTVTSVRESFSLVDLVRARARGLDAKRAYTFLADGEAEAEWLSYAGLDRRARAIAAELQGRGLAGERVLLLFPPGLDFVAAFFGCLYAGAVAVPSYPPASRRSLPRLRSIAHDARPAAALTVRSGLARFSALAAEAPELAQVQWIATDEVVDERAAFWSEPESLTGESLAFLQYTSGSTSAPKGVMVSHGNLLHNQRMIQSAFEQSESSVIVGWLPLYHDMGLIGNVLQPLYVGGSCVLMAPAAFLQKPGRWLAAVSRYRATGSGGPNFAYDLCARRVSAAEKAELDLGSWRVAFSGAEPVRAETLDRFAEAFAGCGFRRSAFYPCYGLAEATLFVSGGAVAAEPLVAGFSAEALAARRAVPEALGRPLVGCGAAWLDQRLEIVDPETATRVQGEAIGEVWVAGPSVAQGYWQRPDVTRETFGARLADLPAAGPFLRTGDLGFLRDGQLFVTGRLKDLIIIRGRNLYPQDLELTAERSHAALRPGCGAAFAVEVTGEERLVVVQEVERHHEADLEEAADAVRRAIAEEHEAQVHEVVLVRTGTIAKTSSGKIQRHANRRAYLDGALAALWRSRLGEGGEEPAAAAAAAAGSGPEPELDAAGLAALPAEERAAALASWLTSAAAQALRVPAARVDPHRPLSAHGLDSLAAVELRNALEERLGASLPFTSLLGEASVAELAAEVLAGWEPPAGAASGAAADAGDHPLSHGQEGLWFLDRLEPGHPAYVIAGAARLRGDLDVGALHRSFLRLVERHAALRTTFAAGEHGPVQRIGHEARLGFIEVDAAAWSEDELDRALADLAFAPFDLEAGPLLRAGVFHVSPGDHRLVLAVHHIVADLWSLGVLMAELGELYAQGGLDRSPWPALAGAAGSMAAHARRQRERLAGAEGERLESYWLRRLAGLPEQLELPTDRPRPRVRGRRGGSCAAAFEPELATGLRELAARRGVTPFTVLLAAFQALLGRVSGQGGQTDVAVGSPTTGRAAAGASALGGVVGYFVNPVVLRGDLADDPSFARLLDRTRELVLEAFAHQDYPFPLLAERLRPGRDPGRPPVFQVALALQRARRPEEEGLAGFALGEAGARLRLGGLELESVPLARRFSQFDLSLLIADERGGVTACLEHDAELFDRVTARRMLDHLRHLLAAALAAPDLPLSRHPMLAAAERHQVLVEWAAAPAGPAGDSGAEPELVHESVERWAEETPDADAVLDDDLRLTYEELNRRANRLARLLHRMGIGPESRVAVGLERSPELAVSALATLKTGAAYLPLDPHYPAERLRYVLEDASASALLTLGRLAGRFAAPEGLPVLRLDETEPVLGGEDGSNPRRRALAGQAAYVIYTSGSTGLPKGTELPHEGLAALARWHREAFGLRPGDRATLLAGPGFDASVWELWSCLAAGATLCVPSREVVAAPEALVGWLAERRVHSTFLPTPLAEAVLEQPLPPAFPVRVILTGGDRLRRRPAAEARFRLVNCYGPTEATVVATSSPVSPVSPGAEGLPAIGRPVAETLAYVVDRQGEPAPPGVPGELWLGGVGLARGYLGRPALTAERFIPDPFGPLPGARLYRTGDLVRRRADGELEFLGRIDQQVKVRGFRIELGEIEACLTAAPGVREAVVVARPDARGDLRLVAYVVPVEGEVPEDLAGHLRQRLPEHMVPSVMVTLPGLPVTPNGKVDRRALPEPPEMTPETAPEESGAGTPEEELLTGIFAEVLGRERVGAGEDFFALGGHSLLATRVASRVREAFGVELPVRRLFEAPTAAALARELARRPDTTEAPPLVRVVDRGEDVPLSFAQERLWFLEQLQPGLPTYNIPAAVRLHGELDMAALEAALSAVAERHEALRTTFAERSGRPVQRVTAAHRVTLPVVDLAGKPEAEALSRAAEEARRPFDLGAGPLLRALLLRLDPTDHVLVLTLHHIVSDGWSMGVLVQELGELYTARRQDRPAALAPLPVQYADFAAWQRSWLAGEALATRLEGWRRRLDGAPAVLELPVDRPRPAVGSGRGGQVRVALEPALSRGIEALGRRQGATRFMVLLAGLAALLHRCGGQDDLVIGAPIAGRTRRELEPLVGLFVNSLALRIGLADDPTFSALLRRARETALEAYAGQDLPFEKLVEELAPERSLAHNPLFQVMLAVQPAMPALSLPGLAARELELDAGGSRLDLTLSLEEGADGLAGFLEYSADLFDRSTAERLAGHLTRLLAGAVAEPERRVWDLPLLDAAERRQVVEQWNQTAAPYPRESCLHELVAARVAERPEAEALVHGHDSLSYAELWKLSGRVASRLADLGVEPGDRVGVLCERTPWMVAGMLGILRAGAAYVPLDPAYPAERLAYIADSGRLSAVLTTGTLAERAAAGLPRVLPEDVTGCPATPPARFAAPESLAYVIYTSGSTGLPKGVAIEHRGAVALAAWAAGVFAPAELSGVLAATSICFDLSVFELFVTLGLGGTVILADDALRLPELPAAQRVRLVNTVPSAIAELERAGAVPPSVRTVNLAGEPLRRALVDRLYRLAGVERVLNLYGPSEDTTYSTWSWVERQAEHEPSIGVPVSNTRGYVLDRRLEPVPVGVPGVLYLAGAGLARGYFGRPELTAERFVPDPFGGAGERLYVTGDLVRRQADGTLGFLGRVDHQVKVRGFRIELGEVEAAAGAHPAVREAVALVRDAALVLCAVARPDAPGAPEAPETRDLRAWLGAKLPSYMVPSAVVWLDALPLQPNGKIDRKALLALAVAAPGEDRPYVAPRTPVEETLAAIWSEVLGVPEVGVYDGFFELGGHSLLATRVVSRVRQAFGVELPLRALFERPTVASLAGRVAAELGGAPALPPLVPVSRAAELPLSHAQQRLWFLDQLEPGSPLYNLPVGLRLSGPLSAAALAGAFRHLVARHESLRTVFSSRDGAPVQRVLPDLEVDLPLLDLSDLPLQEAEAGRILDEWARRPFDLARGPLLRLALLRLEAREHLLVAVLHHIVSDGWSMGVLVREVTALYSALASLAPGSAPELPPLPVQYADFAVWQRRWLAGDALEPQLAYWRERLGGAPGVLEIPADRPRPAVRAHRGGSLPFAVSPDLWAALAGLARGRQATPFMLLLAGFQTLLARWCDRDEVSVATAVAGRRHVETERLIGFFVNSLVLRTSLAGEPGLGELLDRVREVTLGAYTHQDLPFERLVEELQPERSLSHAPLAQVMLVLQNAPLDELALPGLDARVVELGTGTAKLELTLLAREAGGGIAGTLVYDAELFAAATAARLLDHLRQLLAGAAAEPERPWTELPLLTPAERDQLLTEWNAPAIPSKGPGSSVLVHELFAEQARRTPGAPAVRCEERELTYGELAARVDGLARRLRALGVGPEVPVALYTDRSVEMIAGLLAVLAAGGAYVPIDPGAPRERVAFVLADTAAPVVLAEPALADRLPALPGVRVLVLDDEMGGNAEPARAATAPRPENLAYVIYTSGSTGRPKGVAVEHRQLANYVLGVTERLELADCASFATVSTLAADLGNTAIFPALVTGACLHVISRERAADAEAFADYVERHAIDALKIVPSHLAALQAAETSGRGLPRRRLVLGGEATTWDQADALRRRAPDCRVCNHYGPTETTVGVLARPVLAGEERRSASLPLGRPLPGSRVYVLDRRLWPLPALVPGELVIGGAGLSRGYLGRPDLTAERFVPDPLAGPREAGARIYRTGDLARFLPDGEVEFLGRIDHQVKIRGFRVEPGEVTAVLERHPAVREALVVADRDAAGAARLVAYVVAAEAPNMAGLRAFLAGELTEAMIPSAFVFLPALPLTPNGKVDRAALPRPEAAHVEETAGAAPRTPVEEMLAGIWRELLSRERVAVGDDFFALGGHSLLATQLISRVRRAFRVELPLRALFAAPTLEALASAVEEARRAGASVAPEMVCRDGGPSLLSFAQERLWFLDQLHPGRATYNVPYFARLEGDLDAAALARALAEIVRRHEALRTTFPAVDGHPAAVVGGGPGPVLPLVDLSDLPDGAGRSAEAARLMAAEAARPFDLARGPLVRLTLLRAGAREHLLLLGLHHIVSDAWSRGVLTRELEALYGAFAAGRPSPLPDLAIQYADFAAWQRSWMTGEVLEGELAWWRDALGTGSPPLQLPADRPRPATLGDAGGVHPFRLEAALGRAVRELAARRGATSFMVLLAGFASFLHRLSGQDDVTVGSPVANRNRSETEGLIGFFVNTLALRVRMQDDPGFGELVERVRETALGAYDHQDLPFEKLVEAAFRERALDRSPVFQAALVLQNAPAPRPALPGLAVTSLEVHGGTAKFDLTLALTADEEEELAGAFEYAAQLFDAATVERWAGHLATLLRAACGGPEARLSVLPLLTDGERRQLLADGEAPPPSGSTLPAGACLHELFAAAAERTPQAVALVTPEETLTYAGLAGRAGRLAARLAELGVEPEVRVGVFLERSADLIVALLAILEAGGAYVPLDPAYPEERLAFMVEDAGVAAVIAGEALAERLPAGTRQSGLPVVPPSAGSPRRRRPSGVQPGNLAYLIYTSGSTGRPKAVAIEHGNAAALLAWAAEVYSPAETAAVLACSSISFDLSVFEIFLPLARGGRVVLAADALALAGLPAASEVTLINTVPSAMSELVRMDAVPPSARTVNLAGEPLPRALADRIHALGTVDLLFNLYGPSEDTTYSTGALVARDDERAPAIGRPVAGGRAVVVDARGELVPPGVAGELWLGGVGLARGYLGRPELTAERFVPDPFGREPGARLYRTGDLVRRRGDGELEYLGRIDHQVKVRGFRIELGEIEACLAAAPEVREAAVVARPDARGDLRLVAYVVPSDGEVSADLAGYLRQRLPEHMLPSVLVALPALPLTPNGKVDRRALPAPAERGAGVQPGYRPPRTATEEVLAAIWSEVLGCGRIGLDDHFFELGGHSLLATRVTSRVRSVFGVDLPVRALFETPELGRLAARVDSERAAGRGLEAPPLGPAPRTGEEPLSFAQQRLWFLQGMEPESPAYNIPVAVGLHGALDRHALAAALHEVARRHESLRTTFPEAGGVPVQRVAAPAERPLPLVDLAGLPEPVRDREARRLSAREAARPFDLAASPPVRWTLLRLGAERHLALLTLHHVAADGWSIGVLLAELAALYPAMAAGEPSPLAPLPLQYADFAVWQRSWLRGEALERRLAYWRQRLAGAPPELALPLDRPRPALPRRRGATQSARWPVTLASAVGALARAAGASPFMVLLAAWKALLSRYTGQADLTLGTPVANRDRAEIEASIGVFVNTLVLRTDLSDDPAFASLVGRVREVALEAYAYQDLPFERLVEELTPERSLARAPLFQVLFALQNTPLRRLELPGLALEPLAKESGTAKLDLSLALVETDKGLTADLELDLDLFDPATGVRLLEGFGTLLAGAVAEPGRRLSELPLLSEAASSQVLLQWNDSGMAVPSGRVDRLIAERARRSPDAVAVVGGAGEALTYDGLERRAASLARRLRVLGVGPEVRVGLALARSPRLVEAVLGVWKSGGAYVPLDPSHPAERLARILEDARPAVLLTESDLLPALPPLAGAVPVLCLGDEMAEEDGAPVDTSEEPAGLAYVIFTSGSTGRPKGVQISHAALSNFLESMRRAPGLDQGSVMLAVTTLAFDISILELVLPLTVGARVVVADREEAADPRGMTALLAASGATVMQATPVTWRMLLDSGWAGDGRLRALCGGEALPGALAARLLERVGELWNLYGPTETTVWSSARRVLPGEEPAAGSPLGGPIANTRLALLDARLTPVPPGAAGELWIGGAGLARGYLGQPALTADRFRPDPFAGLHGEPGARLYRTGDLTRWLPDGRVEFLGRIDHQVKVRGFRIELGEVESAAAAHPAVREAVALVRDAGEPAAALALYVVPRPGAAGPRAELVGELRGFLGTRLPSYMVPSAVVLLEALPVHPNGKIDRKALAAAGPAAAEPRAYVPPRTPVEETLADIWRSVLGIERVGIHDHFFELGGHSLLAAQVLSRVRETFDVPDLPLRQLFQQPTIAELALTVTQKFAHGESDEEELLRTIQELQDLSPEELARLLEQETEATLMEHS